MLQDDVTPERARRRLNPDQKDSLRHQRWVVTAGDANRVTQCPILRSITKSFGVNEVTIQS